MREVVRFVQNARKQAGLNVDDRITLCLKTESKELEQAIQEYKEVISAETLTKGELNNRVEGFKTSVKIDGQELEISLAKAT